MVRIYVVNIMDTFDFINDLIQNSRKHQLPILCPIYRSVLLYLFVLVLQY